MLKLNRYKKNPILKPTNHPYENLLVFNPAVIKDNDKIIMLYRSQGKDMISRLGYAESSDGYNFKRREGWFYDGGAHYYEKLGIEDPRMVKIEDTFYIVYTATSELPGEKIDPSWQEKIVKGTRISASSTKDFENFEDYHVVVPETGVKNASLFPKKINGNFWLLYRSPKRQTFFSPLKELGELFEVSHFVFKERPGYWDSIRTGIGAPPMETELGWLLFYHGTDEKNVYRLGVMVLDLNQPTRVLYRSPKPILEPVEDYEKVGFIPNVVFTCGAVEHDEKYFVYYGAADEKIALATIEKQELLNEIKKELNSK